MTDELQLKRLRNRLFWMRFLGTTYATTLHF